MSKKIVFVVGMHRSGTSLITKAIQVLGADLGETLMGAAPDNPTGFWEDKEAFEINEGVFASVDMAWDFPTVAPLHADDQPNLRSAKTKMRRLLERKTADTDIFAFKDPRLCLLLPLWLDAAAEGGFKVAVVVVLRNPLDVANSLLKRDQFERRKGLLLWRSHNLMLLQFLVESDASRVFVDYGRFLTDPEPEMNRLSRFLNGDQQNDESSRRVREFIDDFMDPGLSHSGATLDELANASDVAGIVELYQGLSGFTDGGWSKSRAVDLLNELNPLLVETDNYRWQRRYSRQALIKALEKQSAELAQLYQEQKEQALKDMGTSMAREMRLMSEQLNARHEARQEARINELERQKRAELEALREQRAAEQDALRDSQAQTQAHLDGALETVNNIRNSLSYRLGNALTWPLRKIHDLINGKHSGNLALMRQMAFYVIRHPIKSLRMLSWERIRNAYVTFFRNPGVAEDVVGNYARMLHGEELPDHLRRDKAADLPDFDDDPDAPGQMVSLITVNFNGKQHLSGLLDSLLAQDYENFEIILVDNGSSDGSVELVKADFPQVKLVTLDENVGFAEANNIGSEVAAGRYWCLVNNDMEAEPDWLRRLVETLRSSPRIGAVGPKILFWKPFVRLTIATKGRLLLNLSTLEANLAVYPKVFFGGQWKTVDGDWRQADGSSFLDIAVCEGQERIRLAFKTETGCNLDVTSEYLAEPVSVTMSGDDEHLLELDFSAVLHEGKLPHLINNAASEVDDDGNVRDRGFARPDDGAFDKRQEVTALCGGSMIIRPEALNNKPIFAAEFFAYFEDTDLSLRIRENGYTLAYEPSAVIRHKHASTTKENSPFFRYHVTRNRLLFLALHFPNTLWRAELEKTRAELNHLRAYYSENSFGDDDLEFSRMIPELLADWDRLLPKIADGSFFDRQNRFPRIGVYNTFWSTLGGGEHHAGVIATALEHYGPVDLIAEKDFDVQSLERQFGLPLKYCRKRLVTAETLHHDPDFTRDYDLLVNSTFGSDLVSRARQSYYVVSFPHRLDGRDNGFLDSYTGFWANSEYTAGWIEKWWDRSSDVLYPSVVIPDIPFGELKKEKRILHVGRFFRSGHNKKQLELLNAFTAMIDAGTLSREWTLTFVGQVHWEQAEYLDEVKAAATGYPVEIRTDLPLDALRDFYARSAIYWHATGLNEKVDRHPDLFEHFGITTVEAMGYGCVPVVINAGGQPETVRSEVDGFLFDSAETLKRQTENCVKWFEQEPERFQSVSESAYHRARSFSRATEIASVSRLLKTPVGDPADTSILH